MDQFAGRYGALDDVEEADEFLVGVALHAAAVHDAVERVESSEQGGGAVPLVVVRHVPHLPGLMGTPRWVRSSCLDLRFLVDREHYRVGRLMHVQADASPAGCDHQ